MISQAAIHAEANARLLCMLKEEFSAKDFGSISGFCEVATTWRCPCCYRSKPEIARLDKNGNLLCSLVMHHDHFPECVGDHIGGRAFEFEAVGVVENSFERFSRILICQDCNVADVAAKRIVQAPNPFSFAPHEIAGFIRVSPNAPHEVDGKRACEIYEAIKPSMQLLADRLRSIGRVVKTSGETWEHAGAAAWRVLKNARKKRAEAAE